MFLSRLGRWRAWLIARSVLQAGTRRSSASTKFSLASIKFRRFRPTLDVFRPTCSIALSAVSGQGWARRFLGRAGINFGWRRSNRARSTVWMGSATLGLVQAGSAVVRCGSTVLGLSSTTPSFGMPQLSWTPSVEGNLGRLDSRKGSVMHSTCWPGCSGTTSHELRPSCAPRGRANSLDIREQADAAVLGVDFPAAWLERARARVGRPPERLLVRQGSRAGAAVARSVRAPPSLRKRRPQPRPHKVSLTIIRCVRIGASMSQDTALHWRRG